MRNAQPALLVLIADDEAPARRQLRRVLLALPEVELVGEAGDGLEALNLVESLQPDVLVLDIQMPQMDGLEVAANLQPPVPQLIFATAFDAHAIRAFDLAAVDYLLKPWDTERLLLALERARERLGRHEASPFPRVAPLRRVLVRHKGVLHVIHSDEIYSIEAQDNYVVLHTTNGQRMLREPLSALLERLQHPEILRSHRSHAVNLRHAKALIPSTNGDSEILLANEQRVPCSRTYRDQILLGLGQAGRSTSHS